MMSSIKFSPGQENYLQAAEQMYNWVLNSQMRYCKMDAKHPFLCKTYQNLAIFMRSVKRPMESLNYWKRLESSQLELYGVNNMILFLTWKNIGECYRERKQTQQALIYLEKCLKLLQENPADSAKQNIVKRDKEEQISIYQSLYTIEMNLRNY